MKRRAASSRSAVVTPGRHFERSIRRQRAWIAPAAAICSICSGVLTMMPPRYIGMRLRLLFHPDGGEDRADSLGDLVRRRRAVDSVQDPLTLVVGDERLGLNVVALEAVADDLRLVVIAHAALGAADVADALLGGRIEVDMEDVAVDAGPPPAEAPDDLLVGGVDEDRRRQ